MCNEISYELFFMKILQKILKIVKIWNNEKIKEKQNKQLTIKSMI